MPVTLNPNSQLSSNKEMDDKRVDLSQYNFDYRYPRNLDLKPGDDLHDRLVNEVWNRAQDSYRIMSRRHDDWKQIDRTLRAYVPSDTAEKADMDGDDSNESATEMSKIIMPASYAILDTILTYMMAAFLQDPIFRYEGTGPEDVMGAILMEKIIDQQAKRSAVGLSLHTQWRDGFAYGLGAASPQWYEEWGWKTQKKKTGFMSQFRNMFVTTGQTRGRSKYQMIYEGNKLENIDAYRYLPDPNVASHEVQEGEFVGWVDRSNIMALLDQESWDDDMFNIKYVKQMNDGRSSLDVSGKTGRANDKHDWDKYTDTNNPVDIIWMYIDIIPRDWELGESSRPEKWLFGVAGDQVLVTAQPLRIDHNKFPVTVASPDYDGYSTAPTSRLEIVHDLQTLIDWLYTSHIANVRKAINDMIVVDPSLVNIYDVNDPRPGKIIRMRRAAWGRGGIDEAIKQLDVRDVTQSHVADTSYLNDYMQRVTGALDQAQGVMRQRTTRVSSTEAANLQQAAMSRLEKPAKIISMQSVRPTAHMFASHVQQFMDQETYIKATGEWARKLQEDFNIEPDRERIPVSPMDLIVNYDVIERDGTIPGSQDTNTWVELFQVMSQNPQVGQMFDMQRVFKYIARQMGAKNVDDFVRQDVTEAAIMDDEEVEKEVDKGNLVPTNGSVQ